MMANLAQMWATRSVRIDSEIGNDKRTSCVPCWITSSLVAAGPWRYPKRPRE